ncbi:uncharacterized protein LOC133202907 [Saccostrea echinata]|uniref:uncharacterized protein LOC133202907 n=1 Tax=Saccostrea echinata TaxID=191078 RepID=UPI002A836ED2|nr:uncharacterized protein LOC133202907 [Saccostrea echinata]
MGRKEKKNRELLFIHDKMYSIIPDIPTAKGFQEKEKIPSIQRQKPLPLKASGKSYEVLPQAGDILPTSLCSDTARPYPGIDTNIMSEPKTKKLKAPLACLDTERIREKIDKAEKKSKKAKKKTAKPPPKEFYLQINDSNKQHENTLYQMHVPQPPSSPIDPTKPRRIVKIRQSTSCRVLDIGQYKGFMNSVKLQQNVHYSKEYMHPDQCVTYLNHEQYMEHANPAEYAVYKDPNPVIGFMNPGKYNGCPSPTDYAEFMDSNLVMEQINAFPYCGCSPPTEFAGYRNPKQSIGYLNPN